MSRPNCILIMDGYGINPDREGNAIAIEGSPNIKKLWEKYPHTQLGASGRDVGLPDGQMGNSEVGHLNIGAGRIVYQELTRITKEIEDGAFFENEALLSAVRGAKARGRKLHFYGLLSDGGVHSHISHLYALLELAKREGVAETYVHCFMDGRDVSPTSGAGYVRALEDKVREIGAGTVASVVGRYYAMDRDNRWERVEAAYDMLTAGAGEQVSDLAAYIERSYEKGVTDEFILPANKVSGGKPVGLIEAGDSVVFFNFRPDRARQLTRAMTEEAFTALPARRGI